jgi:broad specificity phosphatase PhoE
MVHLSSHEQPVAGTSPWSSANAGTTWSWRRYIPQTYDAPSRRPRSRLLTAPGDLGQALARVQLRALNGMPGARLEAERAHHIDTPYPDGLSYRQVVDQMRSFLLDVAPRYQNQTILLIAHSANRWALQCLLEDQMLEALLAAPFDWQPGWRFTVPATWS